MDEPVSRALPDSKLYTFLDDRAGLVVHLFEAGAVLTDLALRTGLPAPPFAWLRAAVLAALPLVTFLKRDEGLGFYLDSEAPFFRLKLEAGFTGALRALLLQRDFNRPVARISGSCRLVKVFPGTGKRPYTSIIELKETPVEEIVDEVLRRSFQADAAVLLSPHEDQSLLVHRLPDGSRSPADPAVRRELAEEFDPLFRRDFSVGDHAALVDSLAAGGYRYLHERWVRFECPCSRERMRDGLRAVLASGDDPFPPGADELEARCDYCAKRYAFRRADLAEA